MIKKVKKVVVDVSEPLTGQQPFVSLQYMWYHLPCMLTLTTAVLMCDMEPAIAYEGPWSVVSISIFNGSRHRIRSEQSRAPDTKSPIVGANSSVCIWTCLLRIEATGGATILDSLCPMMIMSNKVNSSYL